MANMYHIIEFGAPANTGIMRNTPVDSTTGAYLNIIFNNNPATAFHFLIPHFPVFFGIVIKSIRTYNRTGLNYYVIAKNAVVEYGNIGSDKTILSNSYLMPYINVRCYISSFADSSRIADGFIGRFERPEVTHYCLIGFKWFINYQQCFSFGTIGVLIYDDKGGFRMKTFIVILGMINKYEIARFNFMYLINAGCYSFCIASKLSTYQIGYPFYRNGSRKFHIR